MGVKSEIGNILTRKSPRANGFTGEFYKTFKEKLIPNFLKLFPNMQKRKTFSNSFYETRITLIPKQKKKKKKKTKNKNKQRNKKNTQRKQQADIPDECRCKIFKKILANWEFPLWLSS